LGRLQLRSEPKRPSTGLNTFPAIPTTSLAAVRIGSEPSDPASVPATLKAKPVTGLTNGRTRERTIEISGVIKDFVSEGELSKIMRL